VLNEDLVLTLVVGAGIVASIAVWSAVIARLRFGEEVVKLEPRRPVPWSLIDCLLVVMAYYLLSMIGVVALRELTGIREFAELRDLEADQVAPVQWMSLAIAVSTVVFAFALVIVRVGANTEDLGVRINRWWYDLRLGVLGFFALAAPVYGLQALLIRFFPTQHPMIDLLEAQHDNQTFLVIGLAVAVVAPITEEVLLRVLVQGWLEKVAATIAPAAFPAPATPKLPEESRKSEPDQQPENPYAPSQVTVLAPPDEGVDYRAVRAIPIVASALIFALLHVGQGPAPIPLFLLALGLGYLYQRTHRLWPSLVVHFLLNSTSLAMLWVQLR
jgi:membrane protease YdiL (CAAX protease family)